MTIKPTKDPLTEFREILDQSLRLGNFWHERIQRGVIPTADEAENFRIEMNAFQLRAQAAWSRYCEESRGYELP